MGPYHKSQFHLKTAADSLYVCSAFIILIETNAGLTKVITAKQERKKLKRHIISSPQDESLPFSKSTRSGKRKRSVRQEATSKQQDKENRGKTAQWKNIDNMISRVNKKAKSCCEDKHQ